jgi:hypothetical protein
MADMKKKMNSMAKKPTPSEIDELVVGQAENEAAWGTPIKVRRRKSGSFSIPPDLAERAAFLARVHRASGVEEWLAGVIKERIEIEETAYAAAKRDLKAKQ